MSLFVGNISPNTSKKSLISLFQQFGHCEVEFYRRFAYIKFSKDSDAKNALSEWNGKDLDGTRLKIEISQRKPAGYSSPAASSSSEKVSKEDLVEKPASHAEEDSRGEEDEVRNPDLIPASLADEQEVYKNPESLPGSKSSEEEEEKNPELLVVPSSFPTKTPPNTPNEDITENVEIKEVVFMKSCGKGGLMQEVTENEEIVVRENVINRKIVDENDEQEVVVLVSIEESLLQEVTKLNQKEGKTDFKDLEMDEEVYMQVDLPAKQAEGNDNLAIEEIEDDEEFEEVHEIVEVEEPKEIELELGSNLDQGKPEEENIEVEKLVDANSSLEVHISRENENSLEDPHKNNLVEDKTFEENSSHAFLENPGPIPVGILHSETSIQQKSFKEDVSEVNLIKSSPHIGHKPHEESSLQEKSINENPGEAKDEIFNANEPLSANENPTEVISVKSTISKDDPIEENIIKPSTTEDQQTESNKHSESLINEQSFITPTKIHLEDFEKKTEKTLAYKELTNNQLFDPEFVERELKKVNELCCNSEEKFSSENSIINESEIKENLSPGLDPKSNVVPQTPESKDSFTETPSKPLENSTFDRKNQENSSPFDKMKFKTRLVPFHDPFVQQEPEPEKEKPSIILEMAKKSSEKSKTSRTVVTEEMKLEISPVRRKIKMPRKVQKVEKVSEEHEKTTPEGIKKKPKSKSNSKINKDEVQEESLKTGEDTNTENEKRLKTKNQKKTIEANQAVKGNKKKNQTQEYLENDLSAAPRLLESSPSKNAKVSKAKVNHLLPTISQISKTSQSAKTVLPSAFPKIPSNSLSFMYDILDDETVSISETAFRVKKMYKEFPKSLAKCCVCGKEMKLKSALVHLQSKFHIESS